MMSFGESVNLVVCQKSKVDDWVEHFAKNYDIPVLDLTQPKQLKSYLEYDGRGVGVINYDLIFRRPELLKLHNVCLMLDESSLIQNEHAKRAKALLKMDRSHTILLSGTVVNGKYERLWSQCHLLGWPISREMFWRQYIVTETTTDMFGYPHKTITGYKNIDRLKRKLRDYGGIFMKTEDVHTLPAQNVITVDVEPSKEYGKFCRTSIVEVDGDTLVGDTLLTERMYKRMLCGQYSKGKLQAAYDLIASTDDRLVIFYNYNGELHKLRDICKKLDRPVSLVNGECKSLGNYESAHNSVTLVQYQAGAMGLNLQKANKAVYFTLPDGGSELFEQSKKRIHRIGQDRPCFYYVLTCRGSIEEEIIANLGIKKDRMDYLFREEGME